MEKQCVRLTDVGCHKEVDIEDCKDGSMKKSMCCSCKETMFVPSTQVKQHPPTYSTSSKEFNVFF